MSDDLHNIDDLFKKALEEHTELASSAVWDNIDKTLDKKKVVSISKKYNKLKWAAAILLLFSFGMAMYVLHIRIKDKELVKQTNAEKNLKNQHTQSKDKLKDVNNMVEKDNPGVKKIRVDPQLKPQEKNNDTPLIKDKTAGHAEDTATTDNLTFKNKQVAGVSGVKLPAEENAGKHIIKQIQKKLSIKNKSVDQLQPEFAGIDPADNKNENPPGASVSNNDKGLPGNKKQEGKPNNNFVSLKEKYFTAIPVISGLKEMFQILAMKPISEIHQMPVNNTPELRSNKTVFIKQDKPVPLKQHNIESSSGTLSAMIFFSPDLVITDVKNDHPLFMEDNSHEIKKDEKIKSSSTYGVLVDYNTGKNWKLESGVTFSTSSTDIKPKLIYARPDNNGNINYRFNCSAGYSFVTLKSSGLPPVSGDSIRALTSKNILQYIGVPLLVKYMFGKGRFSITPGAGISVNFLARGKIETTIPTATGNESITSNDIRGLKSTYFSGLASFGAQYKLSKALELTLIPTARFALSSINKDAPVKTYLNSIALAGGIIIKL